MAGKQGAHLHRVDTTGQTVTMWKGFDRESYEEPKFFATVHDERDRFVATVSNATYLALGGDRSKRAIEATDEEIIEAVMGDEHIFGEDYGKEPADGSD